MSEEVAEDMATESEHERVNRNWNELLQELRVTQTGVQILTAFLLTLPFQQRFTELSDLQRDVYLVSVGFAAIATALIIAPVSLHRLVFRRREKPWLVRTAHNLAQLGLVCLALAIVGALWLVFDFVAGTAAALVVLVATIIVYGVLWWGAPIGAGRGGLGRSDSPS
ncbi:MAG TPA: DUF6328 family protein [Nocardioidaceae bacterium]|nr:DUF6328 family protein [Nocardioidaceae bacterium]